MTGPVLPPDRFALTRPLVDWLAQDPAWPRLPMGLRAFFRIQGALGSLNARFAGLSVPPVESRPPAPDARLLIVGPWRSGTTALHELLVEAGEWVTPRTWQCMGAPTLGLLRQPRDATRVRPMDDRTVGANSPQEDEFAMLSLGASSAYRGFLMPHRLPELHATLQQATWLDDDAWFETWERLLGAIVATASEPKDRPLLLKSPNHSFRLEAMLARYPASRFVWVARDPADLLASNLKMWRAMSARYALTAVDDERLQAFLAEVLRASARTLARCIDTVSPDRLTIVTQAELLHDPVAVVTQLAQWLADDARFTLSPSRIRAPQGGPKQQVSTLPMVSHDCMDAIDDLARAQKAACEFFATASA